MTPLHWTIQNILLAANPTTAFLQKASWPGKNVNNYAFFTNSYAPYSYVRNY